MKNWKLMTVILSMLVLMLAACGSNDDATSKDSEKENSAKTEDTSKEEVASAYPMTIKSTDSNYADVTFEKKPEKIVVFDYGFLDTLTALDVEVTAVAKGNFPKHLSQYADDKYANAGGLKEPLFEDIAAMKPDAIFISGRQGDAYEELSKIAPTVFVGTTSTDYWNTFKASTQIAADLFGKQAEVDTKIAEIEAAIEEVKSISSSSDEKALVTLYNETISAYGPGEGSRFGFVHNVYGFPAADDTLENSTHGAQISYEQILEINPDILFVVDRMAATGEESNISEAFNNDLVNKTNAAKNGKIVYLNGALWYLAGGGLTSELEKVNEIINALK
ncbi:ferrichrome ABC transporter substrate-binding protein [Solibacillus sp. R5-41]|uniref:siderophore ABC transporter substrate-binding protein n=1 Tax=Solibacillus sp. R5-41 TaxID=2048654 RepID=UPI000C126757|nr:ABC transporter substrate-binding protein [Solibacillus sp. R5-41]ATP42085.1 ferrichrome ABC transporter substrate-binding protein [Solibacillus sp. R5-41]